MALFVCGEWNVACLTRVASVGSPRSTDAVSELEAEAAQAAAVLDPYAAGAAGGGTAAVAAAPATDAAVKSLRPAAAFAALALNNLRVRCREGGVPLWVARR